MTLRVIQQMLKTHLKPVSYITRFKISYSSVLKEPKTSICQGFPGRFHCNQVNLNSLISRKCVEWIFPRQAFHGVSALFKSKDLPSRNALVQVLDEDKSNIGILTFREAENLARRKKKKLMHESPQDKEKANDYEVFVLSTVKINKESDEGNTDQVSRKHNKIEIKSKISDHDLGHKMKRVNQWIAKDHEVEILIVNKETNPKVIAELMRKIKEAVVDTASFRQSKVNMEKYVSAVITLKPIVSQETASHSKLQPLKFEEMKKDS